MTISLRAVGTAQQNSDLTDPFTNVNYPLPTGTAEGDLQISFYGGKPYDTVPGTPTDFTALTSVASGTTAFAAGTGSVRAATFYRTAAATPASSPSAFSAQYSPGMTCQVAFQKTASGDWTVEATTASSEASTLDVTGAATLGLTTGDVIVVQVIHRDDDSAESSPAITVPGCTVGTVTELVAQNTTNGSDGGCYIYMAPIESGTATGAPQFSATVSGSEGWVAVSFIRLAEPSVPTLAPASASHGHSAGAVGLTQLHVLAVDGSSHTHSASSLTLSTATVVDLVPSNSSHSHSSTAPAPTQTHVLGVAAGVHAHAATSPAPTQLHVLELDSAEHEHLSTTLSLGGTETLVIDGSVLDLDSGRLLLALPQLVFSPPVVAERWTRERPFRRYRAPRPVSLLQRGGEWVRVREPSERDLEGLVEGETFFRGGHRYRIDQSLAADLQAAGFPSVSE